MKKNIILRIVVILVVVAGIVLLAMWAANVFGAKNEITYTQFLDKLDKGDIEAVYVDGNYTAYLLYKSISGRG